MIADKDSFDVALHPGVRQALADHYRTFRAIHQALDKNDLDINGNLPADQFHVRCCPYCRSADSTPLFQSRGIDIVRCTNCNLVYSKQVVTNTKDRERYNDEFMRHYRELKSLSPYVDLENKKAVYISGMIQQYAPVNRTLTVLDIGSNNGCLLLACQRQGWEGFGIEANVTLVAESKARGLNIVQGFFPDDAPRHWPQFDIITMLDVLEHIEEPLPFLKHTWNRLAEGGVLAVQVPNFDSLIIQLEGAGNSNFCHGHWTHFTPTTLDMVVSEAGFIPLMSETFITELDRIKQFDTTLVRKTYARITGQELAATNHLNTRDIHKKRIGYKVFSLYRKPETIE